MTRVGLFGILAAEAAAGHVSCQSRASWEKTKRKNNQTTSMSLVLLFFPSSVVFRLAFHLCLENLSTSSHLWEAKNNNNLYWIDRLTAGGPAGLQWLKQQFEYRRCHYLHQAYSHGELTPDCFFFLVLTKWLVSSCSQWLCKKIKNQQSCY